MTTRRVALKYLCSRSVAYGANEPASSYVDDGVRFLRTTDITDDGTLTVPEFGVFLPKELVADYLLETGDLLLSRSGTIGRALLFDRERHGQCAYAGYLVRFRPRHDVEPRFLFYFTKTALFEDQIAESAIQSTIMNFNGQKFASMLIPVPERHVQSAIATFLDRKTAAIDALVAKKERLIELLQEKRQALITQAVTKGLDPSVPMKESGVEWLGQVPKHWSIRMLKYVATFQRGHDLPSDKRCDGPYPVVSSGGVIGTHNEFSARGPGIVTGRYGSIGRFDLVECDYWALNTALYTRSLWGNAPRFLFYALCYLSPLFIMESKKSAVPGVDRNDLHVYSLAVPPRSEQERIANHLDEVVSRIDQVSEATTAFIEKLREYRQALITAAVTGKIDVPKEAA